MGPDNNIVNGEKPCLCWDCGAGISTADNYCKKCGQGQGCFIPWYYKHWGVFVITFFGLGPFGLYFVWRSPLISRNAKVVYSVLVAALTALAGIALYRTWMYFQTMFGGFQPASI